jgi:hypothetical protein
MSWHLLRFLRLAAKASQSRAQERSSEQRTRSPQKVDWATAREISVSHLVEPAFLCPHPAAYHRIHKPWRNTSAYRNALAYKSAAHNRRQSHHTHKFPRIKKSPLLLSLRFHGGSLLLSVLQVATPCGYGRRCQCFEAKYYPGSILGSMYFETSVTSSKSMLC